MKKLNKKILVGFILLMALVICFGCTPKDPPRNQLEDQNRDDDQDQGENGNDIEVSVITPSETVDTSDLSLLDSIKIDFNKDGFEETIGLYTVAERMPDGEIAWDDGQNWLLVVQGENEDYILFDDYVQLGSIGFFAYFQDEDFVISTMQSGTANLAITEYKFEDEAGGFVKTVRFATDGDVNMFHQPPLKY